MLARGIQRPELVAALARLGTASDPITSDIATPKVMSFPTRPSSTSCDAESRNTIARPK